MRTCITCGNPVVIKDVASMFGHLFEQADLLGMESLPEDDQAIVEGAWCLSCLGDMYDPIDPAEENDDGSCHSCGCQDCDCGGQPVYHGPPLPPAVPFAAFSGGILVMHCGECSDHEPVAYIKEMAECANEDWRCRCGATSWFDALKACDIAF